MSIYISEFDPALDLRLERTVDVGPELVWQAWTEPRHIVHWFTPAPWKTVDCEIDLRPGGKFFTVMESPEGQQYPNVGCYLDVVPNERLVWTSSLEAGYRPQRKDEDMPMTAIISMRPSAGGTLYTATALHRNPEDRRKHEDMGFEMGWNTALDQLVAYIKSI